LNTPGSKYIFPGLGLLIWSFYLLGMLFPDNWWGTHYLAFVDPAPGWSILLLSGGLIVSPLFFDAGKILERVPVLRKNGYWTLSFALSGIAAVLFWSLPIVDDNYGNAASYHALLGQTVDGLPAGFWGELFSLEFRPGQGREGVFLLVNALAAGFDLSIHEGYRLLGALCGAGWVLSWMLFARWFFAERSARLVFLILALGSPLLFVFFGHLESYALVFLILGLWMKQLLLALKHGQARSLWITVPLWLLGWRFHSMFLLLLPVQGLAFLFHFAGNSTIGKRLSNVKGILVLGLLPLLALGLLAYFFVFADHNDPRLLANVDDIDHLFLPILSPAPPLDRYNLLSFNHFFDLFNVLLFAVPGIFFLLSGILIPHGKNLKSSPALALSLLASALIAAMLFMINPLFSLPMDFDLFLIGVPVLLGLTAAVLEQKSIRQTLSILAPGVLAFSLFLLPGLSVNMAKKPHADRLVSVGKHVFKTYYLRSGRHLLYALDKAELEPQEYLAWKTEIINDLRPYALHQHDLQFGDLLLDQAIVLNSVNGDLRSTRDAYVEAANHIYLESEHILALTELHFRLGESVQAHDQVAELIKRGYPSLDMAYRMGVHTALEAELYDKAAEYCREYIKMVPEDTMIGDVLARIEANDRVDELRFLFARGN
jgi:hypothetical protein